MSPLRILLGSVVVFAGGAATWWLSSYQPSEFRGAAPMRDDGVFGYYRYHAPLGEVPLTTAGTYTLHFSGLPAEKMGLQLYIPGGSNNDRELLENLSTELRAEISDSRGTILCTATGPPLRGARPNHWVLMSDGSSAAYWHEQCREVSFRRHTDYTLTVSISNVDPRSPHVWLRAMLEGGGIELS
jgi:hypothetical protein